jgi:hypothetical protein
MFGREVRMPVDVLFPPPWEEARPPGDYLNQLEYRLGVANELARKHLLMSWEKMSFHTPVSRNVPPLDIDRPVLVFDPAVKKGYSPKLNSLWKGPHKLVSKLSEYLYRVDFGRNKKKVIHRSHLFQPPLEEH